LKKIASPAIARTKAISAIIRYFFK